MVSFSISGNTSESGNALGKSSGIRSNINFALDERTVVTASYAYSEKSSGGSGQGGDVKLSWAPRMGVRFESGVVYTEGTDQAKDDYLVNGMLRINFSVP